MNKTLAFTAFLGAVTIILGAFGAHSLQEILSVNELKSFETGVRYQMHHVIVLLFVNSYSKFSTKMKKNMNILFFLGILFFSGSIFAITFGISAKSIWFITPIGGLFLILGWVILGVSFMKNNY